MSPGLFVSSSGLRHYHAMLPHSKNAHIRTFPPGGPTCAGLSRSRKSLGLKLALETEVSSLAFDRIQGKQAERYTHPSVLPTFVISCQLENLSNLLSLFSNNAEDYKAGQKRQILFILPFTAVTVVKLIFHTAQGLGENNFSIEGKLFPNLNKMIKVATLKKNSPFYKHFEESIFRECIF